MVVRKPTGFQIVFSPHARASLDRLSDEVRNRVLATCHGLAELASSAPVSMTPECMPSIAWKVEGVEIEYELVSEQQALWIRRLVRQD